MRNMSALLVRVSVSDIEGHLTSEAASSAYTASMLRNFRTAVRALRWALGANEKRGVPPDKRFIVALMKRRGRMVGWQSRTIEEYARRVHDLIIDVSARRTNPTKWQPRVGRSGQIVGLMVRHRFPLRVDFPLDVALPRDLTLSEARRLARWFRSLALPAVE